MNITILSIDIKTVPTAKGSYQVADVAYKNNSSQGKVEGKKVMSFGAAAGSFKALASASSGETYEVAIVKNDKGYNDWVSMEKASVSEAAAPAASAPAKAAAPVRSTYETPEERERRQVLIVRQSSLSSAVNLLSVGAKVVPTTAAVLAVAKEFENYVFGVAEPGPSGFADLPDDFPEVE